MKKCDKCWFSNIERRQLRFDIHEWQFFLFLSKYVIAFSKISYGFFVVLKSFDCITSIKVIMREKAYKNACELKQATQNSSFLLIEPGW